MDIQRRLTQSDSPSGLVMREAGHNPGCASVRPHRKGRPLEGEIFKMTLEQVIKNIKEIDTDQEESELIVDIISAFENYEYEGVAEIMVTGDLESGYQAYANHEDAPIVISTIDRETGVIDAWRYR